MAVETSSGKCKGCSYAENAGKGTDPIVCTYFGNEDPGKDKGGAACLNEAAVIENDKDKEGFDPRYDIGKTRSAVEKKARYSMLTMRAYMMASFVLVFCLIFGGGELASVLQEQELDLLVTEARADIAAENFDEAFAKAQKVDYTAGWCADRDAKWEAEQDALIDEIIEAEIEATGTSIHLNGMQAILQGYGGMY